MRASTFGIWIAVMFVLACGAGIFLQDRASAQADPRISVVDFDTGWHAATDDCWGDGSQPPDPCYFEPRFAFAVEKAPPWARRVRVDAVMHARVRMWAENRSDESVWCEGGQSMRYPLSYDPNGLQQWWLGACGTHWEIPQSQALEPGETREFDLEWTGHYVEETIDFGLWTKWRLKYGNFDRYYPVVCAYRDEPIGCDDPTNWESRDFYVWTIAGFARVEGVVTYLP